MGRHGLVAIKWTRWLSILGRRNGEIRGDYEPIGLPDRVAVLF
jgi:hypothetical protein